MNLVFIVVEGEREGDLFRVLPGLTIGRSKADISLRDSRVSGVHARIEQNQTGELVLVDAESSNGIWIEYDRVESIVLKPGVKVRIGSSVLEVVEEAALDLRPEERDTWQGKVWSYLKTLSTKSGFTKKEGAGVFDPAVQLDFIRGPQTGERWTLGFGPRAVGSAAADLQLEDPEAPGESFLIIPEGQKVRFKTPHPELVKLNDFTKTTEILKEGDVISIGENAIRISFR